MPSHTPLVRCWQAPRMGACSPPPPTTVDSRLPASLMLLLFLLLVTPPLLFTARGKQRLSPTLLDRSLLDTLRVALSPPPPTLEDRRWLVCPSPTTQLFTARGKQSPSSSSTTTLVLLRRPTQSTLWPPPLSVSPTPPTSAFAQTSSELPFPAGQKKL